MQQMYSAARKTYFVSEHNLRLTELQLGMKLPHAEIVLNPCAVPCLKPLPWPGDCATIRLACIGRLFALEKGQDILIRVLSQKKWQSRPIEVSFVGSGRNQEGLKGMAEMLGVRNLRFPGFVDDVTNVWRLHHALVLPSRCEGMPLTLFEASCLGRPAIATAVGGNAEIIDDNRTGFVAEAANADSFDEALERAWARREEWESIGLAASRRVNSLMTEDPCATFMEKLIEDVHSR
jgi:glycosyltransferase involved in cell wall biosynthesis